MDCWVSKGESIKNKISEAADVKITGIFSFFPCYLKFYAQLGLNETVKGK